MRIDQLRVALFSGNYNYVRDGANQALNRLVAYLEQQGVAVRVYSPTTDSPAFAPAGELVSVPSVPIPGRREYRLALGLPASVRRDIAAFRPTLFHLSTPDILNHKAQGFARDLGVPSVASVHTRFETYFRYYGLGWVEKRIEGILKRFYRRCAEIYAPSECMARVLREQGMSDHVHIWSRGIDHALFSPARRDMGWRRARGIDDDMVVVAFVGRLVLEKGLDVVRDTAAALTARGVPHRLLMVGDGPARGWVEANIPGAILTGFLSGEELARAYASSDVMFNPSITETFGNVTLEAMASALPVVAARATGAMSLVEDRRAGRLVAPGWIDGFADAIGHYVVDAQARAQAGARGRANSARYSWDEINQGLIDRYIAVLGANGVRACVGPVRSQRAVAPATPSIAARPPRRISKP